MDQIEPDVHAGWILSCTGADGGFHSPEQRKSSLQDSAYAIQSLALLRRHDLIDRARCTKWLERAWLLSERGLEQTRWAVVCLSTLDALTSDFVALLESSWLPRHWSLIVSMRVDKQIDHVWSYVQIVSHLFSSSREKFDVWIDGLVENVSESWDLFLDSF